MRIGIMAVGDYCDYDTYVLRYTDLTSNVEALVTFVTSVPATTGGDSPEVGNKNNKNNTHSSLTVGTST